MMASLTASILAEVANSAVAQLPGRNFPGVVIQGDSLSAMHDALVKALSGAKNHRDEKAYYALLELAERTQGLMAAYEQTLDAVIDR
jgi:hypothetical protein